MIFIQEIDYLQFACKFSIPILDRNRISAIWMAIYFVSIHVNRSHLNGQQISDEIRNKLEKYISF